ncbi:MAG: hypothetical protein Q4A98_04545 [Comamonadaceae bacterium]|nr:hypothetical protein [Comamonadaceae bacterium]
MSETPTKPLTPEQIAALKERQVQAWAVVRRVNHLLATHYSQAPVPERSDELTAEYIELRDLKEAIDTAARAETNRVKTRMDALARALMDKMRAEGVDSLATSAGTPYISQKTAANVTNFDLALEWIMENEAWDFLPKRVNKTAVAAYIEAHGSLPPGIEWHSEPQVLVRRA